MITESLEQGTPNAMDKKKFDIFPEDHALINSKLTSDPSMILGLPIARAILAHSRLCRVPRENIRTLRQIDPSVIDNAIEHNLQGLLSGSALCRPDLLINPLRILDFVFTQSSKLKVLSVGPRSEVEIISLVAAGFKPENISALDLISYSPFVDLGDMHSMPYINASFDVIILGWVLPYSKEPQRVAQEVLRVVKPGGIIAVGCEYNPKSNEELLAQNGGWLTGEYPRFNSTDEILKLFDGFVDSVVFRHDVRKSMKDRVGSVMTIFHTKE